jgi:5'-3' exonuclease
VVAPYEADAQLAYLATLDAEQGGVAAVITEDSDLIAYCCSAVRLITFFFLSQYAFSSPILSNRCAICRLYSRWIGLEMVKNS